jgi:hypothetical protein
MENTDIGDLASHLVAVAGTGGVLADHGEPKREVPAPQAYGLPQFPFPEDGASVP